MIRENKVMMAAALVHFKEAGPPHHRPASATTETETRTPGPIGDGRAPRIECNDTSTCAALIRSPSMAGQHSARAVQTTTAAAARAAMARGKRTKVTDSLGDAGELLAIDP